MQKTRPFEDNSWIMFFAPNPVARMRLYCFPPAGGNAQFFRSWTDELSAEVALCPIQLPGHGNRYKETCYTDLEALVEALSQALLPNLEVPFAFCGYSFGALLAFETARYLHQHHALSPAQLFVCARPAPQIRLAERKLHLLPQTEFIRMVQRDYGGIPAAILEDADMLEMILPPMRADFALLERYQYRDALPLPCPISAYGGLQDATVPQNYLMAWRQHSASTFSWRMFPGDHFFVHTHQTELLGLIDQNLRRHIL